MQFRGETPGGLSRAVEMASSGFSFNPKPWTVGAESSLKPQEGTLPGAAVVPTQVKGRAVPGRPVRLPVHTCSRQLRSKVTSLHASLASFITLQERAS